MQIVGRKIVVELARSPSVPVNMAKVALAIAATDRPARSVRGRLVSAQLAPLVERTISLRRAMADGPVVRVELVTDAHGRFVSGPLPPGHYMLSSGGRQLHKLQLLTDRDEDLGDVEFAHEEKR